MKKEKRENAGVEISVRYDVSTCSPYSPLLVTYRNGSQRTIQKIDFEIGGFVRGHSNVVLRGDYDSDKIIPSGETWTDCWSAPGKNYSVTEEQAAALAPASAEWRI